MKVLIVNTLYPPSTVGGAERSVALLARAVAARGHQVSVACVADIDRAVEEEDAGVAVHRMPLRNLYWPFTPSGRQPALTRLRWHVRDQYNRRATADLVALAERVRPDVIHTNNLVGFSTEIWAWAKGRNIRIVHTLRDYSLLCSRASLFRDGRDCEARCTLCDLLTRRKKANTRHVDAVASNSRYVIDAHMKYGYFGDAPSQVIFNIADVSARAPAAPDAGVQGDSGLVTFGFIGRVEPEKGIEIVLEAFSRLKAGNWRLKVAGSGREDYVAGLRAQYPDARIEWLGFANADAFYASVDVVLIPSLWPEPLPRTMIECLARGKPTIFSDAGGIPEIGHMAPRGFMYPRADWKKLAEGLETVLASPESWRGYFPADAGLLSAFAEENVAQRYISLYGGA